MVITKNDEIKKVEKIPAALTRKRVKKNAKGKPKRPMSAYNYFVREERNRIKNVVNDDGENDPASEDYIDEDRMVKLRSPGGKMSFSEVGRLISERWRKIKPERKSNYAEQASKDAVRYKNAMADYTVLLRDQEQDEAQRDAQALQKDIASEEREPLHTMVSTEEPPPQLQSWANTGIIPPPIAPCPYPEDNIPVVISPPYYVNHGPAGYSAAGYTPRYNPYEMCAQASVPTSYGDLAGGSNASHPNFQSAHTQDGNGQGMYGGVYPVGQAMSYGNADNYAPMPYMGSSYNQRTYNIQSSPNGAWSEQGGHQ